MELARKKLGRFLFADISAKCLHFDIRSMPEERSEHASSKPSEIDTVLMEIAHIFQLGESLIIGRMLGLHLQLSIKNQTAISQKVLTI